jgi:hypothetical protein
MGLSKAQAWLAGVSIDAKKKQIQLRYIVMTGYFHLGKRKKKEKYNHSRVG